MWTVIASLGSYAMPTNVNTQSSLYAGPVPQPVNHAHETGPALTDGYSYMSLPRRPWAD